MTITLPLPDSDALAHGKTHWRKTRAITRPMRQRAWAEAFSKRPVQPWPKAVISYDFYFPDNRARDLLNFAHACKAFCDGIVDARVIKDDRWQVLSIGRVTGAIDRENPRVEITVEPHSQG